MITLDVMRCPNSLVLYCMGALKGYHDLQV